MADILSNKYYIWSYQFDGWRTKNDVYTSIFRLAKLHDGVEATAFLAGTNYGTIINAVMISEELIEEIRRHV